MELNVDPATEAHPLPESPAYTRNSSPSPSISPVPALSACPSLDRSFSEASSSVSSTFSRQAGQARSSSASTASTVLRRRGYVRPQGVAFAPSAGQRDSVLSLGSIAHLQYYFARTGLLDGKGGQLAREGKKQKALSDGALKKPQSLHPPTIIDDNNSVLDDSTDASVIDDEPSSEWEDRMMLPPTVSTYSHRVQYIPPPPDSDSLRQDLQRALADADKALVEAEGQIVEPLERRRTDSSLLGPEVQGISPQASQSTGWHQLQGIHILDVVTLAIRNAKLYYTAHDNTQRLYSIKSERQIREELLVVLDVLKRLAGRNFAGGIRPDEISTIKDWVKGIARFSEEEQALEKRERQSRETREWLEGDWEGREREREGLFIKSFVPEIQLPSWEPLPDGSTGPTLFLEALQNGLTLVRLHNAVLQQSKRQFGEIKTFHVDTAKPYRCADNLRFWLKAAEIRWETKLTVDVMGVVYGRPDAWLDFDAAILSWCRATREELTREWRRGSDQHRVRKPEIIYEEPRATD